jgi:hypothetical protein
VPEVKPRAVAVQADSSADAALPAAGARKKKIPRGAWQLYLFQSIPGVGSRAPTDDGVHIKNFWPYLYY